MVIQVPFNPVLKGATFLAQAVTVSSVSGSFSPLGQFTVR